MTIQMKATELIFSMVMLHKVVVVFGDPKALPLN